MEKPQAEIKQASAEIQTAQVAREEVYKSIPIPYGIPAHFGRKGQTVIPPPQCF